jgi:hypothetical protein
VNRIGFRLALRVMGPDEAVWLQPATETLKELVVNTDEGDDGPVAEGHQVSAVHDRLH